MTSKATPITALMSAPPSLPHPHPTPSPWQTPPHPLSTTRTPALPPTTTTLIIGSGITACSLAKALLADPHSHNAQILVCEARALTSGATGRNGGHLVSSAVRDFAGLRAAFGVEMAVRVAGFTLANVERVFEVARECGVEGEGEGEVIRRVEKVMVVRDEGGMEELREAVGEFEECMPERWRGQVRVLGEGELEEKYKVCGAAGGAVGKAGTVWPYRLVTSIWSLLLEKYPDRLRIETWTPVTSVVSTAEAGYPYLVETPRGAVKATEVVYCTNGHTGRLLPKLRGKLFPLRGTMTVQDCGPRFPDEGASRSMSFYGSRTYDEKTGVFDLGLHYMAQNARTGHVFIGGETEDMDGLLNSDDSEISPRSLQTLEGILPTKFSPDVWEDGKGPTVKSKWSGIMGFTADGVPLVGRLPENATGREEGGEWIAAGFNGYGMGNCWLTGEALAAMMRGHDVSAWFPECYNATSARIDSLSADQGAARMFGIH